MKKTGLSSNMEDYLEAIFVLKKKNIIVRVRDISKFLSVKTPSVTSALKTLSKHGFVKHERYDYVEFTKEGEELAQHIKLRHDLLVKFLTNILGVNSRIATEDACKIEHTLSPQTFHKLTKFIDFVDNCPEGERPEWLKGFHYYFKTGKRVKCKVRQITQAPKRKK